MANIPNCLIIGGSGLIGQRLSDELSSAGYPWVATAKKNILPGFLPLDITNKKEVDQVVTTLKPKVIFMCANFPGGVKACEQNPAAAMDFHFEATKFLGKAAQSVKAKLVYISTECVFDGTKETYAEIDAHHPLNIYGQCKSDSEQWIKDHTKDHLIIRTMSVYGWQPQTRTPNALMSAYFAIRNKTATSVASFRYCTPTYVGDLAKAMLELVEQNETGVFHIVGQSYLSRYDWLVKAGQTLGWDVSFLQEQKSPSATDSPYPFKIRLKTDKFNAKCQTNLHSLAEGLEMIKQDIEHDTSA